MSCTCKFHRYYSGDNCLISLHLEVDKSGNIMSYKVTNKSTSPYFGVIALCSTLLGTIKKSVTLDVNESVTVTGDITDELYYVGKDTEDYAIAYLKVKKGVYVISNEVKTRITKEERKYDYSIIANNWNPNPVPNSWIFSTKAISGGAASYSIFYFSILNSSTAVSAINVILTLYITGSTSIMFNYPGLEYTSENIDRTLIIKIPEFPSGAAVYIQHNSNENIVFRVQSDTQLEWQNEFNIAEETRLL